MRRSISAALALACLAGLTGCWYTPEMVRADGMRAEHTLALPPQQAAGCLSRNADNYLDSITSLIRALPQPGHFEVVVRGSGGEGHSTLMVIDVAPHGGGSKASSWNKLAWESQREDFLRHIVKGC